MTAIHPTATAAAPSAQSSADTTAVLHSPTSATQLAETTCALKARHATTATPSMGMDAVQIAQALSPDGVAQLCRAEVLIARKSAETVSEQRQKDATTATRQRATAAAQGAQWSADTTALDSRLCVPLRYVGTEALQALNHATMETPILKMDAARHVPLRWATPATTTTATVLLPSAIGLRATSFVGMAKHSGQRETQPVSATITTQQMATAARSDAQWSADTPALGARQLLGTSAAQLAETSSALATRHATTATPTVVMDAVRAVLLSPDGCALIV
jgi:hypothetical protein